MKYNPSLDGLRAILAVLVVGNHTYVPKVYGGQIGVDVFFVLSGFLITTILRDELEKTGQIDLKGFYLRRAARLMPPLLMCLTATYIFYKTLWPKIDIEAHISFALFYASDYGMALWHMPGLLDHTWSLSVEEHFYLIWPVFLIATWSLSRRTMLIVLGVMFTAATLWRCVDTFIYSDFTWTYYRFDARLSGLILGSLLAVGRWRMSKSGAVSVGWFAAGCLIWLMYQYHFHHLPTLRLYMTLADLMAGALIVALTSGQTTLLTRALSQPVLVYLGVLSYSIYVWHFGIAILLRDDHDPWQAFSITLAMSVVIAALSHRYVEKPIRAWAHRYTDREARSASGHLLAS